MPASEVGTECVILFEMFACLERINLICCQKKERMHVPIATILNSKIGLSIP